MLLLIHRADKLLDSSSKHTQLTAMPPNLTSIIPCRFLLQLEYSNDKIGQAMYCTTHTIGFFQASETGCRRKPLQLQFGLDVLESEQ